jgi:hypothetical protein
MLRRDKNQYSVCDISETEICFVVSTIHTRRKRKEIMLNQTRGRGKRVETSRIERPTALARQAQAPEQIR